jgi:hypothetical protein
MDHVLGNPKIGTWRCCRPSSSAWCWWGWPGASCAQTPSPEHCTTTERVATNGRMHRVKLPPPPRTPTTCAAPIPPRPIPPRPIPPRPTRHQLTCLGRTRRTGPWHATREHHLQGYVGSHSQDPSVQATSHLHIRRSTPCHHDLAASRSTSGPPSMCPPASWKWWCVHFCSFPLCKANPNVHAPCLGLVSTVRPPGEGGAMTSLCFPVATGPRPACS